MSLFKARRSSSDAKTMEASLTRSSLPSRRMLSPYWALKCANVSGNSSYTFRAWRSESKTGMPSDAMYSASQFVIDALAELIETTILISDEKVMSTGRMNQVRYIIQVDKVSFQAEFSSQQLKLVESREMALIVDELMSAIGLQRFRFTDRQNKGIKIRNFCVRF